MVVARRDGQAPDELRALAQAARRRDGVRAAVVGGSPDGVKVAIAVATGGEPDAAALVKQVGAVVGGGGGGSAEVAVAGGREPARLDDALDEARRALGSDMSAGPAGPVPRCWPSTSAAVASAWP